MMRLRLLAAAGAALLASPSPASAQSNAAADSIAVVGATVLPMRGPDRLADQTVLIAGDRIVAIGPRSRIKVPAGSKVIDGRGQVLMPGLVDMHVHLAPVPGEPSDAAQRAMAVMLAHGVTTARGMAGSPNNLVVRGKVETGQLAGPRFYAAAPALHGKNTTSGGQASEAVRKAKAAGYDLIKSHELDDVAVWQSVQDEAIRQHLPTAGHVTFPVGLGRAMAANQQIEHLDGVLAALIRPGTPEAAVAFGQIPPPEVIRALSRISDAEIDAVARKAGAAKSWHVPTLSLFEKIVERDPPTAELMKDPAMRFVPAAALGQWASQREAMQSEMTSADGKSFRDLRRRIVAAFHRAGVPLMAGSDTAQAFHIWGPGLHQEIASLAAAGLPAMDALRAATIVPRDYFRSLPNGGSALGWKADFGTVEPGARADLILLARDPAADLAALDQPSVVIAGGRLFDRPALDAMLAKAAADAKRPN